MHYIPLLFLCAKVFSFIYHRELALFLHNFRAIVEARRSTKKVHIAGAYEISPQGFIYAKIWFKYLMSAQIMFILLQLFHGNM